MQLTEDIKKAIVEHPSEDAMEVARDIGGRFKRHVPVGAVLRVKGSLKRSANVNRAKELASATLDDKIALMERVGASLVEMFEDEALPVKERMEASKELRQWTKLAVDSAGIHDAESDTLFVIEQAWNVLPEGDK